MLQLYAKFWSGGNTRPQSKQLIIMKSKTKDIAKTLAFTALIFACFALAASVEKKAQREEDEATQYNDSVNHEFVVYGDRL